MFNFRENRTVWTTLCFCVMSLSVGGLMLGRNLQPDVFIFAFVQKSHYTRNKDTALCVEGHSLFAYCSIL